MTAGQACVAATRMLVPQRPQGRGARRGQRRVRVAHRRSAHRPDHDDRARSSAPRQRERCERFVGARRGARRQGRARRRPAGRARPGLLLRADRARPARQRQPRGAGGDLRPGASACIGYDDLDDAVRIANDSVYGLSAQVYGADVAAATDVARRLRAGAVNVNTRPVQRVRAGRRLQAERPRPRARARRASARSRRSSTWRSESCDDATRRRYATSTG